MSLARKLGISTIFLVGTFRDVHLFSSYRSSTKTGSDRPSNFTSPKSWQKIPGKTMPGQRSEEVLTAEAIELSHSISGMSQSSREH
ncbi:hypothetical protein BHYA_0214g00150 [Botrytis hyacinthi]|uniref:Uncharacterized protein n=1 Tax=Botrytis hyacinthi TaxID=278943 RepID=A0A4Z1GAS3_9HELO|nr:hypothetical protein BHYA_0214g00150 [Botrytis hyacinthi]